MKAGMYEYYKELPGWAKGGIVIGGALVIGFTGYKIYKGVQGLVDKSNANKSLKDVAADIKNAQDSGLSASFSDSQYAGWASQLQAQFDGCDMSAIAYFTPASIDMSTSAQVLYNIVKGFGNNVDFLKLVNAWGIRTYDACGVWNGDVTNVNLYGAVSDELSSGEIEAINKLLATRNITYKF